MGIDRYGTVQSDMFVSILDVETQDQVYLDRALTLTQWHWSHRDTTAPEATTLALVMTGLLSLQCLGLRRKRR